MFNCIIIIEIFIQNHLFPLTLLIRSILLIILHLDKISTILTKNSWLYISVVSPLFTIKSFGVSSSSIFKNTHLHFSIQLRNMRYYLYIPPTQPYISTWFITSASNSINYSENYQVLLMRTWRRGKIWW